jgi:hypothetical protein
VVVEAPLAQRICARCGLPFEAAGTQAAHEEIEWEVRLVRKGYRCQRYHRTCDCPGVPDGIVAAPPARLIPKPIFYSVCWFLTNFPHGCDLRLNLVVPTRACFFLDSAG